MNNELEIVLLLRNIFNKASFRSNNKLLCIFNLMFYGYLTKEPFHDMLIIKFLKIIIEIWDRLGVYSLKDNGIHNDS